MRERGNHECDPSELDLHELVIQKTAEAACAASIALPWKKSSYAINRSTCQWLKYG